MLAKLAVTETSREQPQEQECLINMLESCRSPATRETYQKGLVYFMEFKGYKVGEYHRLLEGSPKTIQDDICKWVIYLKKQPNKSSSRISTYLAALTKFYTMNDIMGINWKKIHDFEPEKFKNSDDRPYTHEEIRKLINGKIDYRNKAIILLMASTGMRVGAIPKLRIKDLKSVDKYNIYEIKVYAGFRNSQYTVFCTPECRKAIDEYLEVRERWEGTLKDDMPLFRGAFGYSRHGYPVKLKSREITTATITQFMSMLLRQTGLRDLAYKSKNEVMINHGCRKFFITRFGSGNTKKV